MRICCLIAVLALTGCVQPATRPSSPPAKKTVVGPSPKPVEAAASEKPPTFAGVPETPAGAQLAWVLDLIVRRKGVVAAEELETRFDKSFLKAVSADKLVTMFAGLGPQLASLKVVSVKGDDHRVSARVEVDGDKLQVLLEIEPASRQIVGLLLRPDADAAPKPKTYDEALAFTAGLAGKAQLLVASLDKGVCKTRHKGGPDEPLAIGSTFKLYVLLGLADRIIAGKAKWDDELAVRDDWKSLPSGRTQNDDAGTKLTLREFATRMISISDNTATDHLLYTLGRENVESAMRSTKHSNPKLNTPFLGTRELFVLKLDLTDDERAGYEKLNATKRREYLDTIAGKIPDVSKAADWKTARDIDRLEWFATPDDLCRAMGTLWQRAQKPAGKDLLDVLAKNPGTEVDQARWPYVGFKGGSEPGVINMTWLLKRVDDKWFVVVVTANARGGVVDTAKAAAIGSGAIALLGAETGGTPR